PPIVLYFLAATSTKEEYLGSSQAYFLLINFYSIGVRIYAHQMNLGMIPFILVGAVALYIGTYFGGKVVNRIDVKTMKRIAYILVGISGAITFFTSL
ncbi:MAG: hypothetical protein KBS83_08405, partial [Lachnospiraceae bacterium]|nr:hypothetical protein [Candidatus Equihabitans merdae]